MNGKTNQRKNELYGDFIRKPNEDTRWLLYCIPIGVAILISLFLNGKNCNLYDQQALTNEELHRGLTQTLYLEQELIDVKPNLGKFYNESILVFVTPENEDGYNYTLQYAHKLDMVSPVWFTIKFYPNNQAWIDGEQYVNDEYINLLKEKNSTILVTPRLYLDQQDMDPFFKLMKSGREDMLIQKIARAFKGYDGIVFDSPLITYMNSFQFNFTTFLKDLSLTLKAQSKKDFIFITTLQGYDSSFGWTTEFIQEILSLSDKVLVQTYDYPKPVANFKPLSPMNWVKANLYYFDQFVEFQKIMMGVPFFGYQISNNGSSWQITGKDLSIMELEYKVHMTDLQWNNQYKECVIYIRKEGLQYHYPCLKFLETRLLEFQKYKLGFFIWDGGQGLKQFYEIML